MMPDHAQFLFCIPIMMELGYLDMGQRIILIWIVSGTWEHGLDVSD